MTHQRFFSIVVPCYNEERIIRQSLDCLTSLDYPEDRYEVIVVENGSTDATYALAKQYESGNFRVYQSEKGVSKARNFGIGKCADQMEWAVMMDADTFLAPSFLNELNAYLEAHPQAGYGTAEITLDDYSRAGRFWSWYTNVTDRLLKVLQRTHIVRKDLLAKVRYDEELVSGEDARFGWELARYGRYFFMPTKSVVSSARRFLAKGYGKMFFINMTAGLPKRFLKRADWEAIR